jgi:hypothetical protein
MTTTTVAPALDTDALAALREADSLTFHVHQGRGFIRAYLDAHRDNIYTAREQRLFATPQEHGGRRREIPCEYGAMGYRVHGETAWTAAGAPHMAAYASVTSSRYGDGTWSTTAAALRVGDRLYLSWVADNNTVTLDTYGLHADYLTLRATRGEAGKERALAFHVAHSVAPDNTARMIRRNG